jgi:hypothetical protein
MWGPEGCASCDFKLPASGLRLGLRA